MSRGRLPPVLSVGLAIINVKGGVNRLVHFGGRGDLTGFEACSHVGLSLFDLPHFFLVEFLVERGCREERFVWCCGFFGGWSVVRHRLDSVMAVLPNVRGVTETPFREHHDYFSQARGEQPDKSLSIAYIQHNRNGNCKMLLQCDNSHMRPSNTLAPPKLTSTH